MKLCRYLAESLGNLLGWSKELKQAKISELLGKIAEALSFALTQEDTVDIQERSIKARTGQWSQTLPTTSPTDAIKISLQASCPYSDFQKRPQGEVSVVKLPICSPYSC